MITGGAALRLRPPPGLPFQVINAYGPTENTVDSTWSVVAPRGSEETNPAIGKPIDNVQIYVVDEDFRKVDDGEEGELVLGGLNVARGYLNLPKLTSSKFVPDQFSGNKQAKLYRTGDRVRLRPDGELEFIGRIDDQVQLRGFRVELGEVESALMTHPRVEAAVVLPLPDAVATDELAAYIQGLPQDIVEKELRVMLAATLPEYMIPATFTAVERMPFNISGKIDRQALPAPYRRHAHQNNDGASANMDEVETNLAQIWRQLFNSNSVGPNDNFFDLGGSSLMILRLISEIRKSFDIRITPATILRNPVLHELAGCLRGNADSKLPACVMSMIDASGDKRPFFCVAGGGGGAHWFYPLLPYLDPQRPFYVLDFLGLDDEVNLHASVEEIASIFRDAIKQVQPEGPYLLGGFSLGGIFAWELAHQLEQGGDAVPLLSLLDQYGPGSHLNFWPKLRQYIHNFFKLSPSEKRRFLRDKYRWITKKFRTTTSDGETKLQEEHYRAIMQAHLTATNNYSPPTRSGALDIFRSERPPRSAPPDEYAGWGGYAGKIIVHYIPGDHFSMFQPPNNRVFAEEFEKSIIRTEESLQSTD
jgi:thioesterase domain-containing protein/acyl carrier protein